jgi:glycosyltransferase involved in cell wall biosynthesis
MVSVIVPTFNRSATLPRALNSVRVQTFQDWELIVVDDGSTDATVATVTNWMEEQRLTGRARLIIEPANRGVSRARNLGAKAARGEWLAFLDSDDEWFPNRLELQMPLARQFRIIHGEEIWIRHGIRVNPMKKHRKSGGRLFTRCVDLCCVSPSAVLMEAELFHEMSGFREDFTVCEDYELWLRIAARHEIGFVETPILFKYGGHEDQLSRRYKAMDHFRVKALIPHLSSPALSTAENRHLAENIVKRCQILINGYRKHGRTENLAQVEAWLRLARKIVAPTSDRYGIS